MHPNRGECSFPIALGRYEDALSFTVSVEAHIDAKPDLASILALHAAIAVDLGHPEESRRARRYELRLVTAGFP